MKKFFLVLLLTFCICTKKNSNDQQIYGTYQCKYLDGITEREFSNSHEYWYRDYTVNNKLDKLAFGKWSINGSNFKITIDSIFSVDTGNQEKIIDTCSSKEFEIIFRKQDTSSIDFFIDPGYTNPSKWERWEKIL